MRSRSSSPLISALISIGEEPKEEIERRVDAGGEGSGTRDGRVRCSRTMPLYRIM
jgi:hypothetical protein